MPVAINAKVIVAGASGPIHTGPSEPSVQLHLAAPPKCAVPPRHRECSAPLVERAPRRRRGSGRSDELGLPRGAEGTWRGSGSRPWPRPDRVCGHAEAVGALHRLKADIGRDAAGGAGQRPAGTLHRRQGGMLRVE